MASKPKAKPKPAPEPEGVERDEDEQQGDESPADQPPARRKDGDSGEIDLEVDANEVRVTVQRDGNEADTLHRVADLVDGL
jgi:hypothetical protein